MTKGPHPIPIRAQYPKRSGVPFLRACFALVQDHALTPGFEPRSAQRFVPDDDLVAREIITRAAVQPGTTTGAGWAAELAQQSWGAYLAELSPYSGAARLIAQATSAATPDPEFATKYPSRTGRNVPGFVAENSPIPVSNYTFDGISIGPSKKMATIVPWTRELSKRSDADRIFEMMLREDVAAGLDTAFFATSAATSAAPAGLLYGLSALAGYGGGDKEAIEQDLIALSDAVATGGSGNITFIMAPERLARLRIKAPEIFKTLDIAPSAVVPATRVIAADAAALLVAADDEAEIEATKAATIHMSTVPLEIVSSTGPATADPVRSLWQTASTALRLMYGIAFAKRRATAVAYVDNVTW